MENGHVAARPGASLCEFPHKLSLLPRLRVWFSPSLTSLHHSQYGVTSYIKVVATRLSGSHRRRLDFRSRRSRRGQRRGEQAAIIHVLRPLLTYCSALLTLRATSASVLCILAALSLRDVSTRAFTVDVRVLNLPPPSTCIRT